MSAPKLRLVEQEGSSRKKSVGTKPTSRKGRGSGKTENNADAAAGTEPARSTKQSSSSATAETAPSGKTRRSLKREVTAGDLMSSPAVCCRPNDSLNVAAQLLWDRNLGALVVVDDSHEPVSMITDRDICFAAYTQGVPLWASSVASAMAQSLLVCAADTPISTVRALMLEAKVRRLPVVDEAGKVVGVIGVQDIAEEATRPLQKGLKRGSAATDVTQLLAGILRSTDNTPAQATP